MFEFCIQTSVTRKLGGQTHTLINKTNRDGEQEIKEDFINMHQGNLNNCSDDILMKNRI